MELPLFELMINEDVNDDAEVNFVALVDRPAIQKNWNAFKDKVNFQIVSEDKRIISGALMLADTPIFRSDSTHGDYYVTFSKDTILKIAQKFFKKGYQANVNLEYNDDVWEKVKSGEVKGFSVEGVFEYKKEKSKEQKMIDDIKEILSSVKW
jgi:hypothetical protein